MHCAGISEAEIVRRLQIGHTSIGRNPGCRIFLAKWAGRDSTQPHREDTFQSSNIGEYTILDKGRMPSFEGKLTGQNLADIVAYLSSLKAR